MKSRPIALYWAKAVREGFLRSPRRRLVALVVATAGGGFALELCEGAYGQVPQTLNGPPVQVRPYVPEPGVPLITINPGTPNPFSGVDGAGAGNGLGGNSSAAGDGTGVDSSGSGDATGGDYSSDSSGGGAVGNTTALSTMLGTSWGATAVANAQALGVNPSALAATCVLESGCQNVGGSGAQGVFQMFPAAFTEGVNAALAVDPSLASQIVQGDAGRMDPTTEAIAASGYLMQAVQNLQNAGITDPTVLQVRGYYNFGPKYGAQVATADGSMRLSSILPGSFLSQNNISANMTVAQWRAAVSAKIGNAAGQSVVT